MNHTQAESTTSLRSQPTTTPKPQTGRGKDGERNTAPERLDADGSEAAGARGVLPSAGTLGDTATAPGLPAGATGPRIWRRRR